MVNRKTTGNYFYREEKCDVTKIQICEIMGLVSIFRKRKMKKGPSPKISLLVQVGEDMSTGLL